MNLIFMRHCQATDNVEGIISDREIYWSILTEKGVKTHLLDNDGSGPELSRAKHLFEKFGFEFKKIIPNYFAKCNNYDYCPDCGHKPCICSGWEYELKF